MKILLLADEPDPLYWEYFKPSRLEGVELIISCGDLPRAYLEFLTCFTNAPIVYVPGNHDDGYVKEPPEGCICCDGRIVTVKGFRILGLGGCMRYRNAPYHYTEQEMAARIRRLGGELRRNNGFDLLVTHAPLRGHGDLEDLPHRGFECFGPLLERYQPIAFLYAHVHATYTGGRFERHREYKGVHTVNAWKTSFLELESPGHERKPSLAEKLHLVRRKDEY